MAEQHLVVHVDRLQKSERATVKTAQEEDSSGSQGKQHVFPELVGPSSSSAGTVAEEKVLIMEDEENEASDDEAPLIKTVECRICQEEDSHKNMENPCACSGSLKYAHRKCVQRWCDEKGDITCEICHQPYQPGYIPPPPRPQSDETTIDIGGGWQISGTTLDLHDPRLLAIAEAERQLLEAEYEESTNSSGASFCRSAALVLMALLLLRHALSATDTDADGDDDALTFFTLFLIRVAGFLLPCYIMAWAISILQRRRERQEAAALAAAQFAFVLQPGQTRSLQFTIASPNPAPAPPPAPAVVPQQEHA